MRTRFLRLQRAFDRLENSPAGALLWRLAGVMLFFTVWRVRFIPCEFRMEDVEPETLASAQANGLNLLDPSIWPRAWGIGLRYAALLASATLGWWLLARIRRGWQRRFGVGALGLAAVVWAAVALHLAFLEGAERLFPMEWLSSDGAFPVWGGWIELPGVNIAALLSKGLLFFPTLAFIELAFLALHGRQALREAKDGALRARMAPHFLFNALNTLHAQAEEDPGAAQETTERLAGLFRQVMEVTEQPTVPLKRELAFVEDYLGIERARLGERLRVEVEVPEDAAEAQVPVLALQVLVENAIKHGVEPRVAGGTVRIEARMEGCDLLLSVTDPGDGTARSGNGAGQALANLRARLAKAQDLSLEPVPEGFRASLRVRMAR